MPRSDSTVASAPDCEPRPAAWPPISPSPGLGEHLRELLGVSPAAETLRAACERQAGRIASWQGRETASAEAFGQAQGGGEFAVDAGKVNTIEAGWRDLKIALAQKRPPADPATPAQWECASCPGRRRG